ncbi:hypothetical protein, partial [Pseudomonas aeruginosa]
MTMTFQHDDLPLALYSAAQVRDRTLRAKGPALLFEKPTGFDMPV